MAEESLFYKQTVRALDGCGDDAHIINTEGC